MPGANEKPCSQSIGSGWSDKWLGEINTLSEHQQGIFSRVRYHLYFYAKLPPGCTYRQATIFLTVEMYVLQLFCG